ncbi:MAG: long-chain fatty acid--CoA ligase [Desulfobacteraceae bacterium]|nr:MAG: long-chain fatty acid--CoA ligase [Desulfobacteraceae bacterium]
MIIGEILARNARMYGDETALVERDGATGQRREITWKQFDEIANKVANALMAKGVRKGEKVVHLMMNCLEWLPAYFGILRTGAWAVPLNFRFTAEDIKYCVEIAEARTIIFGEEFIDRMETIQPDLKGVHDFIFLGPSDLMPKYAEEFDRLIGGASSSQPDVPVGLLDDAALYFTSGTTGRPKPILLTQRNLEFSCILENRHHNQTHKDNFLCLPPLYHTGAKMHWFGNFIVGAKAVILKGIKPQWILQAVSEEQCTIVWLLVPWAQDILVAIERGEIKLKDYKLEQWRLMHIGAQPVPASLIKNWKQIFPHHDYDTNYGLSESTGPGCVHLGMENLHKVGAIGVPGFDWECRIVDDQLMDVPRGGSGELAVRGPGVMKEYYKNPEATRNTLRDGWLLTGDMARFDENGFIWIVDRKKDIIITGGENIFPVEIEDFLMANSKIQDAAVIGIPDERLGEIVAAVIKPKPGKDMTDEEVNRYCEALPRYKRPKKLFFDDVPRNPTGKIEKPKLRKKYAGFSESFKL